jgi:hypothetical protein
VWRASTGVIHCVFDQIPNLQNCFTAPNKNLGGEGASDTCRRIPLQVNFYEKITFRVWCLYRCLVHDKIRNVRGLNYPVSKVVLALGDEVCQDYFFRQVHTLEVAGFFTIIK